MNETAPDAAPGKLSVHFSHQDVIQALGRAALEKLLSRGFAVPDGNAQVKTTVTTMGALDVVRIEAVVSFPEPEEPDRA